MKKLLSALATFCLFFGFVLTLAACGETTRAPDVTALSLGEKTVVLENEGETEIPLAVTPADGEIEIVILKSVNGYETKERVFDYAVADGAISVKALATGTATISVRAKNNALIHAECKIEVNKPKGYKAYREDGVKFVYPEDWGPVSGFGGADARYGASGDEQEVSLFGYEKSEAYFTASAADFEKSLKDQYDKLNSPVSNVVCTVEKFDNDTAVRVNYSYSAYNGKKVSQVQLIRHAESKTYSLTITNASASKIAVMQKEFFAW